MDTFREKRSILFFRWTMWEKIFFDIIKEEKSASEEEKYMKNKKKKWLQGALAAGATVGVITVGKTYGKRLATANSVEKLTDFDDYNLYKIDVKYDYNTQNVIDYGIKDNQSFVDAIIKEALPYLPVHIKTPDFGCSAFTAKAADGTVRMGRNYDFKYDTSALMVHCKPKDGYESIAFSALDNLQANDADANIKKKLACVAAPFVCLDGVNEAGVSIAVLTLDSKPVAQKTGKEVIGTTLAIRLVLDYAGTTEEAIDLLGKYDMMATGGRDYHFYITDASGDGRVVEYDCEDEERPMKVTEIDAITNFYGAYIDRVEPEQKNGIYGHGKERYDSIKAVLDENEGDQTEETVWEALKASSQEPNPEDITSNTQWSISYNNTGCSAKIAIRRKWDRVTAFDIRGQKK